MAEIKPIQALRYRGNLADNVCPPYDIVSAPEREALVSLAALYNLIGSSCRRRRPLCQAGALLNEWLETGVLALATMEARHLYL